MVLIDILYAIFLVPTFPFWIKYLFKERYRRIARSRFRPAIAPQAEKTIWIHAVSVGEARSLRGLIGELCRRRGNKVVLTVSTPTGYEFARQEYPGIAVIPSPLDFSFVVKRFIAAINPEIILFNELELWPNWIYMARRRRIPMMLINGRISEIAFSKYLLFSRLVGRFLSRLDLLTVQTATYKERFQKLKIPPEKVIVCGNIKADEALESAVNLPAREQVRQKLGLQPNGQRVIVIASSHSSDEKVVVPAIAAAEKELLFILVPRHPERVPEVCTRLNQLHIGFRLLSDTSPTAAECRLLIVDRVGLLFEVISIADAVFMGGTCDPRLGGHNLYEPAVQGKWIIGGPHFQNFADIGQVLLEVGAYCKIRDSEEFAAALQRLPGLDLDRIKAAALAAVQGKRGSVPCILQQIEKYTRR